MVNSPCVYAIVNKYSGRRYIGSTGNLRSRLLRHRSLLRRGLHHCSDLQADCDVNGLKAFKVQVLESISDKSLLKELERRHWLACPKELRYNKAKAGQGARLKPAAEVKGWTIRLRCTSAEYFAIRDRARAAGKSISEYLRGA